MPDGPIPTLFDADSVDKINFMKARMTSYFTRTRYFYVDETTGKCMDAKCQETIPWNTPSAMDNVD